MILKLLSHTRLGGVYEIWRIEESGCPVVNRDATAYRRLDWIVDGNGWVAQILGIVEYTRKADGYVVTSIETCFGTDLLWRRSKKGALYIAPLDFFRPRPNYSALTRHVGSRLTNRAKMFLARAFATGDMMASYLEVFGDRELTQNVRNNINFNFRKYIDSDEGKEYCAMLMKEWASAKGINGSEFFLDKLLESVQGKIENPVQYKILKTLAIAGGNKDVIEMFVKAESDDPLALLDSGNGAIPLPGATPVDAEFKELPAKQKEEMKT